MGSLNPIGLHKIKYYNFLGPSNSVVNGYTQGLGKKMLFSQKFNPFNFLVMVFLFISVDYIM